MAPQESPQLVAIKADDLVVIDAIEGLDPNERIQKVSGWEPEILTKKPTLLLAAAFYGASHVFRYLLASGASTGARDADGRNICIFAAAGGSLEIMSLIDQFGCDWNACDSQGNTCVHYALSFHRNEAVYWLWNHGYVDVHRLNAHNVSCLHIVANNEEPDLIEFFVSNGCNVNQKNDRGLTPLHFAAAKSNPFVINKLLECGADVTIQDNAGRSPYNLASLRHIQDILLSNMKI